MWKALGRIVLRYRFVWLGLLLLLTAFFGWQASNVTISYEFSRAIPTDNPKYLDYQAFRQTFGEDGNLLVVGFVKKDFFNAPFFNAYRQLQKDLKSVPGVEEVVGVPGATGLTKDSAGEKLTARPLFADSIITQPDIDTASALFYNLPFYRGLLYNPATGAWLTGVRINRTLLASKARVGTVDRIVAITDSFAAAQKIELHRSGLPLIRTEVASRLEREMRWLTFGSIALSALILLLFFRSVGATLLSLAVVVIGVVWAFGILHLCGYKITLLTALIPPLVVVIGIPNCIYFLNKYHAVYRQSGDKEGSLITMIARMGVVTLFCNIAAAIGFAVFALTASELLKEFGIVAGISIFLLFIISLLFIPAVLSLMPPPSHNHTRYLDNRWLTALLLRLEGWALDHRRWVYGITVAVLAVSLLGMRQLRSVAYIVDDLPRGDKLYTDLRFFEKNFGGVMPLEIVVDTKKKYGASRNLRSLEGIDSLVQYIDAKPWSGKVLAITEGLKFAKQAFFEGDSAQYSMPTEYDLPALAGYLSVKPGGGQGAGDEGSQGAGNTEGQGSEASDNSSFARLVGGFLDSTRQRARISVTMEDVGSARLPLILDSVQGRAEAIFNRDSIAALTATAEEKAAAEGDTTWGKRRYNISLTGTSVTFLEGSAFIVNGLKESIFWAALLIAACMLYLFRSVRILVCSLLPNILPLIATAGVMGWVGVPLKPSTVLVFSVALGIAIDITIRFLVSYKNEVVEGDVRSRVSATLRSTGLSILYTALVLIAGFAVFCFSSFGGTKALGWLTSFTLLTATVANLTLLPALLVDLAGKGKSSVAKPKPTPIV